MAGFSEKLKGLTSGIFGRKGTQRGQNSPFDTEASPFATGPPGMGGFPDLSAAAPPGITGPPRMGGFPDLSAAGPPGISSPPQKPAEPVANKLAEENAEKIKSLEDKISKVDLNISMVQRDSLEVKKTVDKIDKSILELLSLYEIVSNQVNPFVGESGSGRETIEHFEKTEKRITELGDVLVMLKNEQESISQRLEMSGISPETEEKLQDVDTKLDAFADAMSMLHGSIEKLSSKTDELSTKSLHLDQSIVELAETTNNISVRLDELENMDFSELAGKRTFDAEYVEEETVPVENLPVVQERDKGTKDGLSIVRLESIKCDPMSVVVLLNWIEFLMERVGRNNLMDALDYYVDIGWINEEVRSKIMAYARGIDYYVEKPTWRLLPEDHTKSLLFIERLCGRKIDRNILSTIDREMSKVKHGLEELYGI